MDQRVCTLKVMITISNLLSRSVILIYIISIILGIYLRAKLMGYLVNLCLTFRVTSRRFPEQLYHFMSHQQCMRVPIFPYPHYHLLVSIF